MMPKRIQMTRQRPWRADNPNAVVVSRPSKWGNPHDWRDWLEAWDSEVGKRTPFSGEVGRESWCRSMAVAAFDEDIRDGTIAIPFEELEGRDLCCWCPLDQPCHADVLLRLANPAT